MEDALAAFRARLFDNWLPSFCHAPHRNFDVRGFRDASLASLTAFDAHWFMHAIDAGLVMEAGGFFDSPLSNAKEQIFWEGARGQFPRSIALWLEPVISMGALARAHALHGWPSNRLGMQSARVYAFDLVCYGEDMRREVVACEVKKSLQEVSDLVRLMRAQAITAPLSEEPIDRRQRNAYRKVRYIRQSWPDVFWAVGPDNLQHVFHVSRHADSTTFDFVATTPDALAFEHWCDS